MLTGNRGEWSELYVFLELLEDGRLFIADEDFCRSIDDLHFSVLRIIREENPGEVYDYRIVDDGIAVESQGEVLRIEPRESFKKQAKTVYHAISTAETTGSFAVPEVESFVNELGVTKLKAPSKDKSDITVQVRDPYSGATPIFGWSIKSELGSAPTLLNAGKTTNFTYSIPNISKTQVDALNAISTKSKIKDRVYELCRDFGVQFKGVDNYTFSRNMRLIDTMFPQIMAKALLYYYQGLAVTCKEIVALLEKEDPLGIGIGMYEYKFKKFLVAVALGMVPSTPWDGIDDATGGYIVVTASGDLLCYHLYNRNAFEKYLLDNTRFETASSKRHGFGSIEKTRDGYELKLNLQIRF